MPPSATSVTLDRFLSCVNLHTQLAFVRLCICWSWVWLDVTSEQQKQNAQERLVSTCCSVCAGRAARNHRYAEDGSYFWSANSCQALTVRCNRGHNNSEKDGSLHQCSIARHDICDVKVSNCANYFLVAVELGLGTWLNIRYLDSEQAKNQGPCPRIKTCFGIV